MKLYDYIKSSLDNQNLGASGKKITAMVITVFGIVTPIVSWNYWAYNHNDWNLLTGLVALMVAFVSALFGINEYSKIKSNNNDNEPKE